MPRPSSIAASIISAIIHRNMTKNAPKLRTLAVNDSRSAASGASPCHSTRIGASQKAIVSRKGAGSAATSRADTTSPSSAGSSGASVPVGMLKPSMAASEKNTRYISTDAARYIAPSTKNGSARCDSKQPNRSSTRGRSSRAARAAATAPPAISAGVRIAASNWPSTGTMLSTSWISMKTTPMPIHGSG